jgi:hypothetical protein
LKEDERCVVGPAVDEGRHVTRSEITYEIEVDQSAPPLAAVLKDALLPFAQQGRMGRAPNRAKWVRRQHYGRFLHIVDSAQADK